MQEVPDGTRDSSGGPWQLIGLLPLFDPPRNDSADTIRRALDLGVNVKMITGAYLHWHHLPHVLCSCFLSFTNHICLLTSML